jgi:hypothetical protein
MCGHLFFLREITCQTACKCSASLGLVGIVKKIRAYKGNIPIVNVILHWDKSIVSGGELAVLLTTL